MRPAGSDALNVLAKLGAGFDIVSQGELERVLATLCNQRIVAQGAGRTDAGFHRFEGIGGGGDGENRDGGRAFG